MAEAALFSVASKLLSKIASPAFDKAYEKGQSIWKARDELAKLKRTIQTIQARLLDAEKKQESSAAVKDWIKRVKEVLYDAEDLFDKVATDDMLKQQMEEGHDKLFLKKVRVSCSKLNPIISRNSIAKKVEAIRKSLLEISRDMDGFQFVLCEREEEVPKGLRRGQDPGCFVDATEVIGRDEDKKALLEMLFDESDSAKPDVPVVISVVGIGGMGKTTFSQLVYNDEEVKIRFEKRWFACISDISDEKEVLGKIFQSISGENYNTFDVGHLQTKIREATVGKKFLLVLDDVWDEDRARWLKRMSLLRGGAKGSRIIVTTRSPLVVEAVGSLQIHNLDGLSEDESWSLFKRVAFTHRKENDPRWEVLGREIVKKCRNVPLAIISIGSLLFEKNTIQEWESFKNEELSKLKEQGGDSIMSALKFSYDHLPSHLKHCFAYCSLFPEDFVFGVQKLINLWIAQGYIDEDKDHSCFLYLLRRGFFQEARANEFGEIESCKMHDLIHELAVCVAGEERIVLTSLSSNTSYCGRHVSIGGYLIDESLAILTPLLDVKGLRSCLLTCAFGSICNSATIDQLFASFKVLRALDFSSLGIKNVSSAIGELKHLRYLDLSRNRFETLPDSMTNLVNLITLDIGWCRELKVLPDDLRKLINLRFLNINKCKRLKHMPDGLEHMRYLEYLSNFKVGKAASEVGEGVNKRSGLDVLARLQHQLRGELSIDFQDGIDEEKDWDLDECRWKWSISLQGLVIRGYRGKKIPDWNINGTTINNLASLELKRCYKVKYLPPLRLLPNLRFLTLDKLLKLECVEEEENNNVSSSIFFPSLEKLIMFKLPRLKRWWTKVASTSSTALPHFPLLSLLYLYKCPKVEPKYFPLDPHLREQCLDIVDIYVGSTIFRYSTISASSSTSTSPPAIDKIRIRCLDWLEDFKDEAFTSLQSLEINNCNSLKSLHLTSPHLQAIAIEHCPELQSFDLLVEASLRVLKICWCPKLKNLRIAGHLNALEELLIRGCNELELCHVDWDSFTNLRQLELDPLPPPEELPLYIRQLHALGQLKITDMDYTALPSTNCSQDTNILQGMQNLRLCLSKSLPWIDIQGNRLEAKITQPDVVSYKMWTIDRARVTMHSTTLVVVHVTTLTGLEERLIKPRPLIILPF